MIMLRYSEINQDSARDGRSREIELFDQAISLLERGKKAGHGSIEEVQAIHFTCRFWTMLMEDLAGPDNALTKELKAGLISIGIWILKESDKIRQGEKDNIEGILEICRTVRKGL